MQIRIQLFFLDAEPDASQERSGSVTFWYGSGSVDPYLGLTDPDPALFVSDLQDANKKYFFINFI